MIENNLKPEKNWLKPYLNIEECDALIRCIATEPLCVQVGVLLPLLAGTRLKETVTLRVKNFDKTNNALKLTVTKNGKPRTVPLPGFFAELLKEYVKPCGENDYILPTPEGRHITIWQLNQIIDRCARLAGLQRDVALRDLRRTYFLNKYRYGCKTVKYAGLQDNHDTALIYFEGVIKESQDLNEILERWAKILRKG